MKDQAIIARRPCGCLDEIYDPKHHDCRWTDSLESNGFQCELVDGDAAEAIPYAECTHGDMQKQLAALVKKQAGEIEGLRAERQSDRSLLDRERAMRKTADAEISRLDALLDANENNEFVTVKGESK